MHRHHTSSATSARYFFFISPFCNHFGIFFSPPVPDGRPVVGTALLGAADSSCFGTAGGNGSLFFSRSGSNGAGYPVA